MDFTIKTYSRLLDALKTSGIPFKLRHDVDLLPGNSLRTAEIESQKGIKATYYFRCVPESYDEQVIKAIAALGHEIGYHYESLTTCNGDMEAAYDDFCHNLEQLRTLAPSHSICMHGSPRSPWDSRDLYTGRRWDGFKVSVRDKIPQYQELWESQGLVFHTTEQIIAQLLNPLSPLRLSKLSLLITTHPQRWNPFGAKYVKEYCFQSIKNIVKHILVSHNNKKSISDNNN